MGLKWGKGGKDVSVTTEDGSVTTTDPRYKASDRAQYEAGDMPATTYWARYTNRGYGIDHPAADHK
ncbi:hypothetical protein [Streptomyces sp. NBC_01716]|uniref:hypothetical protein n=1 Tax=Streptomyces sp. NBC_01716 TaxID=2975917 RepID=UPI002E3314D0|nr:hypothetical protein [Streptomyces sp. NBC_01716]